MNDDTRRIVDAIVFEEIQVGRYLFEYQPGNSTRYLILVTDLEDFSDKACSRIGTSNDSKVVTILTEPHRQRSMVVNTNEVLHPSRMKRLTESIADQKVLAEVISHVLELKPLKD